MLAALRHTKNTMTSTITLESILPALITSAAALAALWFLFWLVNGALQRWSDRLQKYAQLATVRRQLDQMTRFLRHATSLASIVIAGLVMLYGVGLRGVPRITWEQIAGWISGSGLPILFILGSAYVLIRAQNLLTHSLPDLLVPASGPLAERLDRRKRIAMRGRLARWIVTTLVLLIAGVMTLKQVGVDVAPLLTGGAIISVALGFGAQNLVRDVIAGLFFILEDQVRVGDVATVNGQSGEVEAIHLRTTVLRSLDGTVHIFPNGAISSLSNLTKNFSFCVLNLGVAYKENVDHVMQVLDGVGRELCRDAAFTDKILAPLEILGVDDFAESAVVIKLRIKTVPLEQWGIGRELRRRIKNTFDAAGIEIPYRHLVVVMRDGVKREAPARTA